jgi:hypothetical protein
MANPDTRETNVDSLTTGIPVAILFLSITVVLFQFRGFLPAFNILVWVGLPFIIFAITTIVNVIYQYINCKTTNFGKGVLGALPSLGTAYAALGLASISYCRIPIASVFAPMIMNRSVNVSKNRGVPINSLKNSNSKECCTPRLTLESIEETYPIIQGISYGFYILFASLFGMVIGSGLSSIC